MRALVNLTVDLRDARFDAAALARAHGVLVRQGFNVERVRGAGGAFAAWIDEQFGGTWSSEADAGSSVVAKKDGALAGFAAFDPRGLKFAWLRGLAREPGVGIFGPFGVHERHRGSGVGAHLLTIALASLRERGYTRALIPAVGGEQLTGYYRRAAGAEIAEEFSLPGRRFRTVVLASGNGSNFQSVVDAAAAGRLPLDIALLVSNKAQAHALERARGAGIASAALMWDRSAQSREQYDSALLETVRHETPALVLLLGWMHVLDERFIREFPGAINIHPAFLPLDQTQDSVTYPDGTVTAAFRGAHAAADALASGSRWVGASSHLLAAAADRGPVLTRKPLAVRQAEPLAEVMARLHPLEHQVLESGIRRWIFEQ